MEDAEEEVFPIPLRGVAESSFEVETCDWSASLSAEQRGKLLSFSKGEDVYSIVPTSHDGWSYGEVTQSRRGYFPSALVALMEPLYPPEETPEEATSQPTPDGRASAPSPNSFRNRLNTGARRDRARTGSSSLGARRNMALPEPPAQSRRSSLSAASRSRPPASFADETPSPASDGADEAVLTHAKALYAFDGSGRDDQLSLVAGEIVHVLSKDSDWWYAFSPRLGEKGFIPSTYVTQVETSADNPTSTTTSTTTSSSSSSSSTTTTIGNDGTAQAAGSGATTAPGPGPAPGGKAGGKKKRPPPPQLPSRAKSKLYREKVETVTPPPKPAVTIPPKPSLPSKPAKPSTPAKPPSLPAKPSFP